MNRSEHRLWVCNVWVMTVSDLKIKLQIGMFTLSRIAVSTSYRMVYPFLPVFARGLGVEPTSLALAFSIRSFLGVFGPFLASIADTHDRKTGILLGIGLFTVGSGVVGIWPSAWSFILGTSLALLGNGVFIPSVNAYLGDHIAYEKRGRVMAFLELFDDRYAHASTIISTQVPISDWYARFPDPTLADAVLDRIVHSTYQLNLLGDSQRKLRGFRSMSHT